MKAINIRWDIDEEDFDEELDALPEEIEIPDDLVQQEDEDAISDYITDQTGFCHLGFDLVD